MNKPILLVAASLALSWTFSACSSRDEVTKTENEVMAIHDQLMPKMDDVMRLKKQLKLRVASLDSLKASGSAAATLRTDEEKEQANRLSRNLTVADSLMMDWMDHYDADTVAKLSSEDAMKYLTVKKDQISDVKTKYDASLEQARQFLGKK